MLPIKLRAVAGVLIAASFSVVLYRYWLITPVLQYMTINEWRMIAILVAISIGVIWPMFKWNVSTLIAGFVAGMLVSGTWLQWQMQDVRPRSVGYAFESHLESFWLDVTILSVAVLLGGNCSARLAIRRTTNTDNPQKGSDNQSGSSLNERFLPNR